MTTDRGPSRTVLFLAGGLLCGIGVVAMAALNLPSPDDFAVNGVMDGLDINRTQFPVRLMPVSPHLPVATDIQAVPGHAGDLAILQKGGVAVILTVESRTWRPWFELEVNGAGEMGLLGLAFAPDFQESGVFFVHRSPPGEAKSAITRFTCNPQSLDQVQQGPDVLTVDQPYRNHNGGQIVFGPDGYLYVTLGDGGSAFDPEGNGQNGTTLLGSILRIDPRPEGGYDIPPDNPFVGDPEVDDAIFAMGLRNAWRFTFDGKGRLVAADVGQNTFEEVNIVPSGANLGWPKSEGPACLRPPCETYLDPVWVYGRQDGISITGGLFSYTTGMPVLDGKYVFGDFGSGRLWALELPDEPGKPAPEPVALGRFPIYPSTFGLDHEGRLYVADFQGLIHRVEPRGGFKTW